MPASTEYQDQAGWYPPPNDELLLRAKEEQQMG